jgi:hypothetical protein
MVAPKEKINISTKKTEEGWAEANDKFFLYATPLWFKWLGWAIILVAIKIISNATHDRVVQFIEGISYFLLAFYIFSFFIKYEFHGIPLIKNDPVRVIVSSILTLLLITGVFYLLMLLASVIALNSSQHI